MEGHLLMSRKELGRKGVLALVQSGHLSLKDAARRLGLSYRQCRRVYQRYCAQGDEGLIHRSRGRPSNRNAPAAFREAVVAHYVEHLKPVDMGPTLAAEKLSEAGMPVKSETLRRWLIADKHWTPKQRRDRHRERRERRARFGELVQMDGSHHRWFGPDGRQCSLMNLVDDATGKTYSLMFEEETTEAAMRVLWGWIERYGIPQALYVDRKTVYITERTPTVEEQLADQEPLTVFGKACAKLGIQLITAYSPQAKGRVVRTLLDGTMELEWRGRGLHYHEVPATPVQSAAKKTKATRRPACGASKARKPAANHPWKQGCTLMRNEKASSTRAKATKP